MLDPTFLEAWTHRPGGHTVLGRKLHGLCALDLLALEAVNSPFLYDGAECDLPNLVLATWILSNPHESDLTVGSLELSDAGKAWIEALGPVDLKNECEAIGRYMADYYAIPEMFRRDAARPMTALGSPWMLSTVTYVVSRLHIPLADAWTMGIGQLFWYRCSLEEQESESRVVSPELREEMKKAENGARTLSLNPGESLEQFCERTGISMEDAAFHLHNQSGARGP